MLMEQGNIPMEGMAIASILAIAIDFIVTDRKKGLLMIGGSGQFLTIPASSGVFFRIIRSFIFRTGTDRR